MLISQKCQKNEVGFPLPLNTDCSIIHLRQVISEKVSRIIERGMPDQKIIYSG